MTNVLVLGEILSSIPNDIPIISGCVTCDDDNFYITAGIRGKLRASIIVKLLTQYNYSEVKISNPKKVYDLKFNRGEMPKKSILVSESFCYVAGGLVNQGISFEDTLPIHIRHGLQDWLFQHIEIAIKGIFSGRNVKVAESRISIFDTEASLYDLILSDSREEQENNI